MSKLFFAQNLNYRLFVILLSIMWLKPTYAANEYNFYFYGDDGSETKKVSSESKNSTEFSTSPSSDDERVKKLAREVVQELSNQNQTSVKSSEPSTFLSDPENYISMGFGYPETRYPLFRRTGGPFGTGGLLITRIKLLPYISFEGALPINELSMDSYRVGAALEGKIFKHLSASMGGGIFHVQRYQGNESSDPFVGIGLKMKLLNHISVLASYDWIRDGSAWNVYRQNPGYLQPDIPFREILRRSIVSFGTIGLTYDFL